MRFHHHGPRAARRDAKPVHRRLSTPCATGGSTDEDAYKKWPAVVGDVIGKFSTRTATRRCTMRIVDSRQDFAVPLSAGSTPAEFGNIDGINYRYTEARLTGDGAALLAGSTRHLRVPPFPSR